jgi:hypothetical protein
MGWGGGSCRRIIDEVVVMVVVVRWGEWMEVLGLFISEECVLNIWLFTSCADKIQRVVCDDLSTYL